MNEELAQIIKEIACLSPQEKVEYAVFSEKKFLDDLEAHGVKDGDTQVDILLSYLKLFLAADGRFSKVEYDFFQAVTGLDVSYEDLKGAVAQGLDPEFQKGLYQFSAQLSGDGKTAVVSLGVCLISCDYDISEDEADVLINVLRAE